MLIAIKMAIIVTKIILSKFWILLKLIYLNWEISFCLDNNVDWTYLKSIIDNKTVYEVLKEDPNADLKGTLVKFKCLSGTWRILEVAHSLALQSKFPSDTYVNYADYFNKRYKQVVTDMNQSMIEVERSPSPGFNFLLRSGLVKTSMKKAKINPNKIHYAAEHLEIIPFKKKEIGIVFMLPNIFHRLNCLLKTAKFKKNMEKELIQKLNITNKVLLFFILIFVKF